ncbi:MAG: replicative DNA helicase [Planctomycetota bacterium]
MTMNQKNEPRQTRTQTPRNQSGTDLLNRVLPHNDGAERSLLGSMLREKEAIGQAITVLRDAGANAFDAPNHQSLYEVLVHFYTHDLPLDGELLRQELTRRGWWEELGGYDFLASLVNSVASSLRAPYYAEIVRDNYLLRQLISANHRVMEAAYDNDRPIKEILDYTEKEIFDITERRVSGEAAPLSQLMREVVESLRNRGDDALTGEPTGFTELDALTCGLQPSELIIVAGRPSMGKTAFGLNIAEHLAIVEKQPRPILFFSLEMSRQQVAQRILCSQARVNLRRLASTPRYGDVVDTLADFSDRLAGAPLYVDESSNLTILELRARARMAARKHNIRAVFVDYLQLMHLPNSESRQQEVANISRGLKALAKDLKIPVIAMAQLNRNPEDRTRRGNRPRMSDLRESGAIEQDADVVMLLHRESYFKTPDSSQQKTHAQTAESDPNENLAELIIAKQRNGPTGTIKLHFNRQYTRFDNHDPRGADEAYAAVSAVEDIEM